MPITLGSVAFDEAYTTVREKQEEVGGRNERAVTVSGAIVGRETVAEIEAALDAIIEAASVEDFTAPLSLRPGRRLLVRRNAFRREVKGEALTGAFTLELAARDPFEESIDETEILWNVSASGATQVAASAGNVHAKPVIEIAATGDLVNPAVSDGSRTLAYAGIVRDGETLVFDARSGTASLEGIDVTPYTAGEFPRIEPEGVTLTYTDDAASTHTAAVSIRFRDRWW
jgi:hypothetical protein